MLTAISSRFQPAVLATIVLCASVGVDRTELTLSMRRRPTWTLTKNQRRLWNVCPFLVIAAVMTPGGLMTAIAIVIAIAIVEKHSSVRLTESACWMTGVSRQ